METLSPWPRLRLATCPHREASVRRHARRRVLSLAVRRAHLGDLDHLVRIEEMCFGTTAWRESDLRDQFDHAFARVAVFVDEGGELGDDRGDALGFILSWEIGEEVQLMRLGVTPEHQKKGIGSLLMGDLVRSVEDRAEVITLEVRVSNKRAQAFYEKFGFHNLATRPRYYNNGEDAVLMEYKLGSQHDTKEVPR